MKLRRWLRAAVVAVLLAESRATATTTYSAPIRDSEGESLTCFAQNHTSASVDVAAVLRNQSGAAVHSFSSAVNPGDALSLAISTNPVAEGYCEFEFDGDADAVRGFIRLTDSSSGNTVQLYPSADIVGVVRPDVVTYSPPVVSVAVDLVSCVVQNLGAGSVQVAAQLRNSINALVGEATVMVAAGDVVNVVSAVDPAGATYCRFAFDGNPSAVRGYVRISGSMGENSRFLAPATELPEALSMLHTAAVATSGGVVRCAAQNLGETTVLVNAALIDSGGDVVASGSDMLPAGHVSYILNTGAESDEPLRCRFTIAAREHRVRPFLTVTEPSAGRTRLVQLATGTGGVAGNNATTYTASVRDVDGSELECWALNLGEQAVDVTSALFDLGGNLIDDAARSVASGHTQRLAHSTQSLLGAYCRFVFDGSPADVRTYLVLNEGTPRLLETASIASPLTPLPTSTATRTDTRTRTSTSTQTPTRTASASRTPTNSATPTPTPSATTTQTPTLAATPTATTPAATATVTPASTETRTATAIASPTASPAPGFPGDPNCDGIISAPDLTAVSEVIVSGIEPGCGEDANEDGMVDEDDVRAILRLIFQ